VSRMFAPAGRGYRGRSTRGAGAVLIAGLVLGAGLLGAGAVSAGIGLPHLVLTPDPATIAVGGSQAYAAESVQIDTDLGDVTSSTTFTIAPDGSCTANSCSPAAAGDHTVTGTASYTDASGTYPITGTAVLHVPRPPAPPFFAGEVFDDTVTPVDNVVLLFFGSLDQSSVPDGSAFAVTINGVTQVPSSVTIPYVMYGDFVSGVRLGLTTPIQPGQSGTVSYTKPPPNLKPLLIGVDPVPTFGVPVGIPLSLLSPQDASPFSGGVGIADEYRGRNHITALFNQQLTTGALPDPSDFSVTRTTSDGSTTSFSPTQLSVIYPGFGYGFLDLKLPLTLAWDDVVTFGYTPSYQPAGRPLLNLAGTESAPGFGPPDSGSVFVNLGKTPLSETLAGSGIAVVPDTTAGVPGPVGLTFGDVTQPGETYLTVTSTGPPPPAGFEIGDPPIYYDVQTTAVFDGSVTVCISYAGITPAPTSLLHYQNGAWADVTTLVDTTNQKICGSTTSLSPFALATRTRPILGLPSSVTAAAIGPAGAVVTYLASAVDAVGAALTPVCVPASGSTFPVGTTTVTCTASDAFGQTSSASFPVTVGYGFAGFLQPINDPISSTNPMSVFKSGSTIVVKFALTYANGTRILDSAASALATACGATISLAQTAGAASTVDEVVTSTTPNSGVCFRYDATAHQFLYNLGTKGLTTGARYVLTASIASPDGTLLATHRLAVGIR
jgi:hypothetical protein